MVKITGLRRRFLAAMAIVGVCLAIVTPNILQGSTNRNNAPRTCEKLNGARIACIGDSVTVGKHAVDYPQALQEILTMEYKVKGVTVRNFGASGRTAGDTLESYRMSQKFKESVKYQPEIALVMLGTNDAKTGVKYWTNWISYRNLFENGLASIVTAFSRTTVYVLSPIPAYSTKDDIQPYVISSCIQPSVANFTRSHGVRYIDTHSPFLGVLGPPFDYRFDGPAVRVCRRGDGIVQGSPSESEKEKYKEFFRDGIHPTTRGYEVIARTVAKVLCS